MKTKRKSGNPAKANWQPMKQGTLNPELVAVHRAVGSVAPDQAWWNDLYQCVVTFLSNDVTHLSIKRHDRAPVRDWRHFQQIKNEVCGDERLAVEIYPPESRLVDTANEYHLWVFPEGMDLPFGFDEGMLGSPEQIAQLNATMTTTLGGRGKARQRAWQPGLTTGLGGDGEG